MDAPFRWWIAGGWALDLFLGTETRPHSDVDVAVFRDEQDQVYGYLPNWTFEYVQAGTRHRWSRTERLELPVHEIWARRRGSEAWQLEFVLNESHGSNWLFRRDPRIRLPLAQLEALRAEPLPFLPPEIVLLYKSNRLDAKSEQDFAAVAPSLTPDSSTWLRGALAVTDPAHPWIEKLPLAATRG